MDLQLYGLLRKYIDKKIGQGGAGGGAPVDNTLSISGAAADAKVTGDKIFKLEENLKSINLTDFIPNWDTTLIFDSGSSDFQIGILDQVILL